MRCDNHAAEETLRSDWHVRAIVEGTLGLTFGTRL